MRKFLRRHLGSRSTERTQRRSHASETLEDRVLLTTTFFFDFGAGLPAGGLNTNVDAFRDVAGANTGTDLALDAGMTAGDPLTISRLNYDFDGNGTPGEVSDMNALGTAALPLIQRALEPFDITAVLASATNLGDVATSMAANTGDVTGEFDAYNFVTTFTSTTLVTATNPIGSVGQFAGLFGLASRPDFNGAAGNFVDEATQSYADRILNATPGVPGTAQFNANLAQRSAYTATHEAGHTMGLRHATGLEAGGDIIRLGSATRDNPFMVMRFDLNRQNGPPVVNNYDMFAADADIGLRDFNTNGTPDLAFVSGTGGHDLIDLDANGATMIDVDVDAFTTAAMTTLIDSEVYTIDTVTDTESDVLIDAGTNSDIVDLEGSIAFGFRIRGGTGSELTVGETDILRVDGGGADATLVVSGPGVGTLSLTGGASVNFSEFETLDLNNLGQIDITGAVGNNAFEVSRAGAGDYVVTVDGFAFNVAATEFTFNGGVGNDTLTVDNSSGVVDTTLNFAGAVGLDTLAIEGNPGVGITRETYLVGATQDAGQWILDPDDSAGIGAAGLLNSDEMIVNFTGLDPVDTSVPVANFDVFLTAGVDQTRFEGGGLLAGVQSVRVVDLNGTFETFRYTNKTNITVDALGNDDVLGSYDSTIANGEVSRTLIGNDGNDLFQLGEVNTTAVGGIGNDIYAFVTDSSPATVVIDEQLGEGSDAVTFAPLATPGQSTDQSGVSLATAGAVTVDVAAAGQQKNIEFGINALPYLSYTVAPPVGVPFMTMDYELEYADVGTMSTHTALFDWGDGNSDPGIVTGALGMGVVNGSHQFDTVDTFNVLASITDNEGLTTTQATITDIMQFALLPDAKMPGFTALFVGGTVGIDILEFRQTAPDNIRVHLDYVKLGDFIFDGGVFAFTGSGNDIIAARNTIAKNLTFEGGGDVDILKGSIGDDMLFGQGGKDIIYGREGSDMIEGGDERDHIWGEEGDDTITGGEGNDVIRAGDGHDVIDGGSGNDKIKGEKGHDLLLGRGNNDTLSGGKGHDVMFGGSGLDKLNGGKGNDLLLGDASTHDADPVATFSIYDEWVNGAGAIPARIANVQVGGGLNGANILSSGVTIFDDGKADVLKGTQGSDWYLVFAIDKEKGFSPIDDFLTVL